MIKFPLDWYLILFLCTPILLIFVVHISYLLYLIKARNIEKHLEIQWKKEYTYKNTEE